MLAATGVSSTFEQRDLPPDAVILESMGVALMAVDAECRIIRFNGPAGRLTGYSGESVVGRHCSDVLRASLCKSQCPLRRALQTGTTCRCGTVIIQTSDQRQLTVEVTASALEDETGAIIGAVGILRDVSDDPGLVRIYGSRVFTSRTPAMRRIFDALPKLASSKAPMLIVGGRGSGRSALAETIHNLGSKGTMSTSAEVRPLVKVSCTSSKASESLAQALGDQQGSRVQGGSLLLEDICGAPIPVQQQLLAWIEDGGENLGFRLISTATEQLETCIKRGTFRSQLFYRLNVLHVAMPSLAERAEDIPLLVDQFIEDLNLKRGRQVEGLTAAAMRRLLEADFPGNVRQLRMVIDHAHARCPGELIDAQHLPELSIPWNKRKASLEKETIQAALARVGGNITRAAEALQMHRTTLWRKIKRLGIKP
jgi:PAS domain S-box-containing protein